LKLGQNVLRARLGQEDQDGRGKSSTEFNNAKRKHKGERSKGIYDGAGRSINTPEMLRIAELLHFIVGTAGGAVIPVPVCHSRYLEGRGHDAVRSLTSFSDASL
jgi:hypothetical protein